MNNIIVERSRILNASVEQVFALLSDPASLANILPRVQRVEVLSRDQSTARVRTHMSMGMLGSISSEGEVRWLENRELLFSAQKPAGVTTHWKLEPQGQDTQLSVCMTLDLRPMLGPLAAFVPPQSVEVMIAPDLDQALDAIAQRLG